MTAFKQLAKKAALETATHPVALVGVGLSAASLATARANKRENEKIRRESAANSEKQLHAMNRLTTALTGVETSLNNYAAKKTPPPPVSDSKKTSDFISKYLKSTKKPSVEDKKTSSKKSRYKFLGMFSDTNNMKTFKEKQYTSPALDNIIQKTLKGASIGALIGTPYASIKYVKAKAAGKKDNEENRPIGWGDFSDSAKLIASTTITGAALGAICGMIQNLDDSLSKASANNNNLMDKIQKKLKQLGYVGNKDYTKDPKFANLLKTKVCIVISRSSDDLKLLINMAQDDKLKDATSEIVDRLPKTAVVTEKAGNRFNDFSVSTLSRGAKDVDFIVRVIEMFIKRGFPVYLVEVG